MGEGKKAEPSLREGRLAPPRSLRTCGAGHETCWPEACPVCRGIAIPAVRGNDRQKLAVRAYWEAYRLRKAAGRQ